ncbi:MAG TPA: chalcone isomerase family protein [Bryobacteraceae bacterium]|nr:chalcone isomerase family protein [Bryobacteraceae bacterium]
MPAANPGKIKARKPLGDAALPMACLSAATTVSPSKVIRPQSWFGPSTTVKTLRYIVAAGFWCAAALNAAAVEAREMSGVRMPEVVSVAGEELRLNGIGVRKRLFSKVYVVGLYLERPTTDAWAAITTDETRRIVLVMLRDVSRKDFVQAVENGVKRNSGPVMPALRARLDLLKRALPALKKGNVLDIMYLPGRGTLVRGQGREMWISGKDFADALLSVWLGPKPVDEDLKRQLLGG